MKITWNNLRKGYFTTNGTFRKKNISLYIKECEYCKDVYLGLKNSKFCNNICSNTGENNYFYGKKLSKEHKEKLSIALAGKNNPMYEKTHTKEARQKISKTHKGKSRSKESIEKQKKAYFGYYKKNIPKYDTYNHQIKWFVDTRRSPKDERLLEVKCIQCGKWYIPKRNNVRDTIRNIKEGNASIYFYCSEKCKQECPIYRQNKYPKDYIIKQSSYCEQWFDEEYKKDIRKRDNCKCQNPLCEEKHYRLDVHHIDYDKENCHPNNLITLCNSCHSKSNYDREWHQAYYEEIIRRKYDNKQAYMGIRTSIR